MADGERVFHVLIALRCSQVWEIRADSKAEAAERVGRGEGRLLGTRVARRTTKASGYSVIEPGLRRRG